LFSPGGSSGKIFAKEKPIIPFAGGNPNVPPLLLTENSSIPVGNKKPGRHAVKKTDMQIKEACKCEKE